tara:strand:- start:188 stop:295 length:108 start_codon:yes stop_codon:yes gene_type:complete
MATIINEYDETIDGDVYHVQEFDDGEFLIAPISND